MPTTVNGIGTHYYGKRNYRVRQGVCHSCGKQAQLASYETRLFFVVIFIPIVPLGRKQILDDCPHCRRHMVADPDEFAISAQLATSEGRAQFERQPTVEAALRAHAQMLGHHQHDEAEAFRAEVLQRFPHDALLRTVLASHAEQTGRYDVAKDLYSEAHRLQPDLADARIGLARYCLGAGETDAARRLLDVLLQPGAGQVYSLSPLEALVQQYQKRGDHRDALKILQHVLAEMPGAADHHEFRKLVRTSEKALGEQQSILPAREGSALGMFNPWNASFSQTQRTLAVGGLLLAVVLGGLALNNEFLRRRRTVHLVSGLGAPVTVQVDDLPPVTVNTQGAVTVPEGQHVIRFQAPFQSEQTFEVRSGYFDRFFKKPAWVVNLLGSANVISTDLYYAQNPRPSESNSHLGENFLYVPHVDYLFVPSPDSLRMKENEQVHKVSLELGQTDLKSALQAIADPQSALNAAEGFLRCQPTNAGLWIAYDGLVEDHDAAGRAEDFLKTHLEERPVLVEWHRLYQQLAEKRSGLQELVTYYDAQLAADPENGSLLYLRSRIEEDRERERALRERAKQAAPGSPWPWSADGYDAMCRGDWQKAKADVQAALQRNLDPAYGDDLLRATRLGCGEAAAMLAEHGARLQANPLSIDDARWALTLTVLLNGPEVARQQLTVWQTQVSRLAPLEDVSPVIAMMELVIASVAGDFAAMERMVTQNSLPGIEDLRSELLINQGRPGEILANPQLAEEFEDGWQQLKLAVALQRVGRADEAKIWRDKALASLRTLGRDGRKGAAVLEAAEPPSVDALRDLELQPAKKLLLLCDLVQQHPELRSQLQPMMRTLNVVPTSPYHLVRQVLADPAGPSIP